jgi:hypothetical protein
MQSTHRFVSFVLSLAYCVLESLSFVQRFQVHRSMQLDVHGKKYIPKPSPWKTIPETYDEVLWENGELLWDFLETKKDKNGTETNLTSNKRPSPINPDPSPNSNVHSLFTKKDQEKPKINIKYPIYTRISSNEMRMAYM